MEEYLNKLISKIKNAGIKKIIITVIFILLLFFIISTVSKYIENKIFENNMKTKEFSSMDDFESIREIVTYMGCNYISEKDSKTEGYLKNIYLEFNKDLYNNDDTSNQKFFENLSGYIAYFLNYSNFAMIDSSREIVIEVICDKENKQIIQMIVNGNSNYFADEDTKRKISKYKEIEETNFEINSDVLKTLLESNWSDSKVNFGAKDSSFDNYDIYFNEGIEVRKIGKKVFNIVFTQKYLKDIINNLGVGENFEEIEKTLGKPAFKENNVIGYKNNKIYIFFTENEVSVYRVDNENNEDFVNLINNIEEINVNKIVDKLTDIWIDYDEYVVTEERISITYSSKGVKFQYNVTNQQGFILYNNYTGNIKEGKKIKDLQQNDIPKYVYIEPEEDLLFIKERLRIAKKDNDKYICNLQKNTKEENGLKKASEKINYYIQYQENITSIKFFDNENNYPKTEIKVNLNSYIWLDDYRFMYSIKNKGIYIYDIRNQNTITLVEGSQEYTFIEYNSNILKYDENSAINIK